MPPRRGCRNATSSSSILPAIKLDLDGVIDPRRLNPPICSCVLNFLWCPISAGCAERQLQRIPEAECAFGVRAPCQELSGRGHRTKMVVPKSHRNDGPVLESGQYLGSRAGIGGLTAHEDDGTGTPGISYECAKMCRELYTQMNTSKRDQFELRGDGNHITDMSYTHRLRRLAYCVLACKSGVAADTGGLAEVGQLRCNDRPQK